MTFSGVDRRTHFVRLCPSLLLPVSSQPWSKTISQRWLSPSVSPHSPHCILPQATPTESRPAFPSATADDVPKLIHHCSNMQSSLDALATSFLKQLLLPQRTHHHSLDNSKPLLVHSALNLCSIPSSILLSRNSFWVRKIFHTTMCLKKVLTF